MAASLTLAETESRLSIERIEVFCLYEVHSRVDKIAQQLHHHLLIELTLRVCHHMAAPVIGEKGFRRAFRPNFDAAIGNHSQLPELR